MIIEINNKDIIEELFKDIFKQELKVNIYSKIAVYKENDILGFLVYDLIYDRIELEYIGVKKEYRKKNIGSKLMEYLINKNLSISLEVDISNINAINLYEKYGFKKVSIRKNYYEGKDAYLMLKEV